MKYQAVSSEKVINMIYIDKFYYEKETLKWQLLKLYLD